MAVARDPVLDFWPLRLEVRYRIPSLAGQRPRQSKRGDSRLVLVYKSLKSKASIPTDDLIPMVRHCMNHHSLEYQVPIANTVICKCLVAKPEYMSTGPVICYAIVVLDLFVKNSNCLAIKYL